MVKGGMGQWGGLGATARALSLPGGGGHGGGGKINVEDCKPVSNCAFIHVFGKNTWSWLGINSAAVKGMVFVKVCGGVSNGKTKKGRMEYRMQRAGWPQSIYPIKHVFFQVLHFLF